MFKVQLPKQSPLLTGMLAANKIIDDSMITPAQRKLALANAAHTQAATKLLPLSAMIQAQNAATSMGKLGQSQNRFGKAYQLVKSVRAMPEAQRSVWFKNHADAYNQAINDLGNAIGQPKPTVQNYLLPSVFKRAGINLPNNGNTNNASSPGQSGAPMSQPSANARGLLSSLLTPNFQGSPNAATENAGNTNTPEQPNTASPNTSFSDNPQSIGEFERASEMNANKKLGDTKVRQQMLMGKALENFINTPTVQKAFQVLSQYPGIGGSIQKEIDQKIGNPKYVDYESATNQLSSLLAGGISQLEGFAKTDKGLQAGLNFFKKSQSTLSSNPQLAIKYFHKGMDLLKSRLQALKEVGQPMYNVSLNTPTQNNVSTGSGQSASNTPTREEALAELKKRGET